MLHFGSAAQGTTPMRKPRSKKRKTTERSLKPGLAKVYLGPNATEAPPKPKVVDVPTTVVLEMAKRLAVSNDVGSHLAYLVSIFLERKMDRWWGDRTLQASHGLSHTLQDFRYNFTPFSTLAFELSGEGVTMENKWLKAEFTAREQALDHERAKLKATASKVKKETKTMRTELIRILTELFGLLMTLFWQYLAHRLD
ncbi:protein SEY1 [Striga asiatica]|uniref:Protein SEY1 n=1 Tax=Striga asiatica TaxID=4170 RepID=A0A5A7PT43_STRAF|nr:protein SEY1 [Striga asiatica]